MNLVKYQPGKVFGSLLDEFFNGSISDVVGSDFRFTQPSVNIIEEDENFKVEVAAPGLDKSDFNVEVDHDTLIISATKEEKKDETSGKVTRSEFNFSSFTRRFHLPETVNAEQIHATYENGILSLSVPKREEAKAKAPKTIEIK